MKKMPNFVEFSPAMRPLQKQWKINPSKSGHIPFPAIQEQKMRPDFCRNKEVKQADKRSL
ncbi:MAG: hypothetical protein PVI92_05415 [Chromatiales bacterium]